MSVIESEYNCSVAFVYATTLLYKNYIINVYLPREVERINKEKVEAHGQNGKWKAVDIYNLCIFPTGTGQD